MDSVHDDDFDGASQSLPTSTHQTSQSDSLPSQDNSPRPQSAPERRGWIGQKGKITYYASPTRVWRLLELEVPYEPEANDRDPGYEDQHPWEFEHEQRWIRWNSEDAEIQNILQSEECPPEQHACLLEKEYEWSVRIYPLIDEYRRKRDDLRRKVVREELEEEQEAKRREAEKRAETRANEHIAMKEIRSTVLNQIIPSRLVRTKRRVFSFIRCNLIGMFRSHANDRAGPGISVPIGPSTNDRTMPVTEMFLKKLALAELEDLDDYSSESLGIKYGLQKGIPWEMLMGRKDRWVH
ncbi:unnamed protein product [Discula destructiva]